MKQKPIYPKDDFICEVCKKPDSKCSCPECPRCGNIGNPECYLEFDLGICGGLWKNEKETK